MIEAAPAGPAGKREVSTFRSTPQDHNEACLISRVDTASAWT